MFKRVILYLLIAVGLTGIANAQHKGLAYIYSGIGGNGNCPGCGAEFQIGGGAERVMRSGLGLGAELGYSGNSYDSSGLLSLNSSYHFKTSSMKISPFMTGGGSATFKNIPGSFEGSSSFYGGFNVGGGVHYWFREGTGLRLESKYYKISERNTYLFRVGIAFR